MKKKNSRKQFTTKHTKALRAEVLALLEQSNVYLLPERRIATATAIAVVNRDLRKTRNSEPDARVFSAIRAVSSYIALAAHNKVSTAALSYADLLPVGHPHSKQYHAMTASALRHAQAQWIAADPMIDDSVRSLVASAHAAEPGSIERKHAFARIAAMPAGLVPLTASIDMNTQVSPVSEFVGGFGIGGNSDAARSIRAKLQRRDRYGRFAYMGGGFSFSLRGLDGLFSKISGSVVGATGSGDGIEVEITGNDILPDGIYTMPASKGSSVKAILSKKTVSRLPNKGIATAKDDVFVDVNDIMPTRKDAPTGWSKMDTPDGTPLMWNSEDGYFVKKDGDVLTLHRANLADNSIGEEVARGDSWSDMQKNALADQDDYQKVLEAADTTPASSVDLTKLKPWQKEVLGPRKVGGKYKSAYGGGEEYEVLDISFSSTGMPLITVRGADGFTRTHSTAWDARRDKVLSEPEESAVMDLDPSGAAKPLRAQIEDAIENGKSVRFNYSGKPREVTPKRVWTNPKNGNENMTGLEPDGTEKNFTLDRIESIDDAIKRIKEIADSKKVTDDRTLEEVLDQPLRLGGEKTIVEEQAEAQEEEYIQKLADDILDDAAGYPDEARDEVLQELIDLAERENELSPKELSKLYEAIAGGPRKPPTTPPSAPTGGPDEGPATPESAMRDLLSGKISDDEFSQQIRALEEAGDISSDEAIAINDIAVDVADNDLDKSEAFSRLKQIIDAQTKAPTTDVAPGESPEGWKNNGAQTAFGKKEYYHTPEPGQPNSHTVTEKRDADGNLIGYDVWRMGWSEGTFGDNVNVGFNLQSWDDAFKKIEEDRAGRPAREAEKVRLAEEREAESQRQRDAAVAKRLEAFEKDPLVLSMDNGSTDSQIQDAIKNKKPIKFKYNGKDQTVLPLRTYYNSKTGQTNVVVLTSKNKELTFSMDKMEVLPKTPLTPQQIRDNELNGLVNNIYNAYTPDPYEKYADSLPGKPYGAMPKDQVIDRLAAADLTPEERQAVIDRSFDKNYAQSLMDAAYPPDPKIQKENEKFVREAVQEMYKSNLLGPGASPSLDWDGREGSNDDGRRYFENTAESGDMYYSVSGGSLTVVEGDDIKLDAFEGGNSEELIEFAEEIDYYSKSFPRRPETAFIDYLSDYDKKAFEEKIDDLESSGEVSSDQASRIKEAADRFNNAAQSYKDKTGLDSFYEIREIANEPPTGGPSAPTGSDLVNDIFGGAKGRPASEYSDKLPENSEIIVVAGDGDVLYGRNEDGSYYMADMTVDDDEIRAELIDPSDPEMMAFLQEQFVDGATDTEAPIVFYRGGFVDPEYEKEYLATLPKPPSGGPGEPPTGGPSAPTGGPSAPIDPFSNLRESDPKTFEKFKDIYDGASDREIEVRMALEELYSIPFGRGYEDPATGEFLGQDDIAGLIKKYDTELQDIRSGKGKPSTQATPAEKSFKVGPDRTTINVEETSLVNSEDLKIGDVIVGEDGELGKVIFVKAPWMYGQPRGSSDPVEYSTLPVEIKDGKLVTVESDVPSYARTVDSTKRTASTSDSLEKVTAFTAVEQPEASDIAENGMPDFLAEQFDEMFTTPEGAYQVNVFDMYEPEGRTNQASPDFTDDPQVLSQKFTKDELTAALADAVLPKDGGDASGYGNLQFENGDEPVKAEAIYDALSMRGMDNPEKILSDIYDLMLPEGVETNAEKFAQRQADEDILNAESLGFVPVPVFETAFTDDIARSGILGTPSRTQNSVDLMKSYEETNPKIKSIAEDLKEFQDSGLYDDGENLEMTLEKYLPLAYSDDPDDQTAFNAYWGMLMSLDGGMSEPDEYKLNSGFRATLFGAIEKQVGEDNAEAAYNDFIAKFGGFADFVDDKDAMANGTEDLDSGSVAADFFRLMKEASRPNEQPLFRIIGVSPENAELLEQYTTVGNSVGFDPRPFSTNDTTAGTFIDSLTWDPGKDSHRLVFVAAPGEINSIDATSVSWYSGENEHIGYGQVEIKSVRRQPSGIPGRLDEFIVEIARTDTTPDQLASPPDGSPAGAFSLEKFDVSDWRKTGGQAGSNEGGFYQDADGVGYYVKVPPSPSHAENEVLASALYEELGVPSAKVRIGDNNGDLRVVSVLIEDSQKDFASKVRGNDEAYLDQLRADFAIDAWLANWDVTGTGFDNVVSDVNGNPVRVDPGGALMWRAQGMPKGGLFGDTVGEIDSLRDPELAEYGAQVFGSMTDEDIKKSAKKLLDISPSRIDEIVDGIVTDPEQADLLKSRLKARRQDILDRFGITPDDDDILGRPVPLTQSIGFEAQDLQAGDILGKDSFVIENVFRDDKTPAGKVSVEGYYPGHETQRKEWNEKTVIDAARGSTVPPKGTEPAIHKPKKPRQPVPPAFTGEFATEVMDADTWEKIEEIIRKRRLVFFDYETTGFGPGSKNMPVQLGAVVVENGEIVDRFNVFMDPTEELSDWSRENLKDGDGNPLTDEFLSQQVGMAEAHALFADWMGREPRPLVAAHNLPFDREIFERMIADANVEFTPGGYIDTLSLSRVLIDKKSSKNPDGTPGHTLKQLMDHNGLEFGSWHTADADAEAAANLFLKMIEDMLNKERLGGSEFDSRLQPLRGQQSQFEKDIEEHQKAVKEYQDALAKYNADIAVAAAMNCGGAGLTAAVGEGNGPCSVPSVDDLIDATTIKPGELSDPEAITSGNPDTPGDDSDSPVDAPVAPKLTQEQIDARKQTADEMFAELADQIEEILDPEKFKLKNVARKNLEKARDDVASVREDLEAGTITEDEAVSRLQAILDEMPAANMGADATELDVEIGVFQDSIADLRDALDITKMPVDYGRPVGPGLPPPELGPDFGYSKDGVFLVPGSRVRDKFGYLGTVVRYQENGWIGIYYKRDVDGEISLKNIKQLTSVPDNGDLRPWIYDPNVGEGKRPANWKELVTPEEMAAADAAAKAAKAAKKKAGGNPPKAKAPQGAPEATEVPVTPEVPKVSDYEKKFSDPDSFNFSFVLRTGDRPYSPWALTSEDAIWNIGDPIEQGRPIIVNFNGKDTTLQIESLSFDSNEKQFIVRAFVPGTTGPQKFPLKDLKPVKPVDVSTITPWNDTSYDLTFVDVATVRANVELLMAEDRFEDAGKLASQFNNALDKYIEKGLIESDSQLVNIAQQSQESIDSRFGPDALSSYYNSVQNAAQGRSTADELVKDFKKGWASQSTAFDVDLSGRPRPEIENPKPISASSFDGVNSLIDAVEKSRDSSNTRVFHSAAVDGGDIEDFEVRSSITVDSETGEKKLRLKFKLTAWAGQEKATQVTSEVVGTTLPSGDATWVSENVIRIPRSKILPDGTIEVGKTLFSYGNSQSARTFTGTLDVSTGEAKISILRGNQDTSLKPVNNEDGGQAFHNMVIIDLPVDATEADIKKALENAGVKDVRATEPADVKTLAENRLLSVFAKQTDASVNERSQIKRNALLTQIKEKWGVTADDIVISTDSSGFLTYKMPKEVASKIAQETGTVALEHTVTIYGIRESLSASMAAIPGSERFVDLTRDEQNDLIAGVLADLLSDSGGLKATIHRYTEGAIVGGMSSSEDIGTGGAAYVFTRPKSKVKSSISTDDDVRIYYDPVKAYQRIDFYANEHDEYGRRFDNHDVIENARSGISDTEVMFKNGLSADEGFAMLLSPSMREKVLKALDERGIKTIGGRPANEFVVDYFDSSAQRGEDMPLTAQVATWMNGSGYGAVYNGIISPFTYTGLEDILADPTAKVPGAGHSIIAIDDKLKIVVYSETEGKYYKVDLIKSNFGSGKAIELDSASLGDLFDDLKKSHEAGQDSNMYDGSMFTDWPGSGNFGKHMPLGVVGKDKDIMVKRATIAINEMNQGSITSRQAAQYMIKSLLAQYGGKTIAFYTEMNALIKSNPELESAIRDLVAGLVDTGPDF